MELRDALQQVLDEFLDNDDLVNIHNDFCDRNYYDGRIYFMDDLNWLCKGMRPLDILENYSDINTSNYYIQGTDSFDYYTDAPYTYYDEIIDDIIENNNDYGFQVIRDTLDEHIKEEIDEDEDEDRFDDEY